MTSNYDNGFHDGLLSAQRRAAQASNEAHADEKHEAANALANLASDLLIAREGLVAP